LKLITFFYIKSAQFALMTQQQKHNGKANSMTITATALKWLSFSLLFNLSQFTCVLQYGVVEIVSSPQLTTTAI